MREIGPIPSQNWHGTWPGDYPFPSAYRHPGGPAPTFCSAPLGFLFKPVPLGYCQELPTGQPDPGGYIWSQPMSVIPEPQYPAFSPDQLAKAEQLNDSRIKMELREGVWYLILDDEYSEEGVKIAENARFYSEFDRDQLLALGLRNDEIDAAMQS
jgi:hypothetical protein